MRKVEFSEICGEDFPEDQKPCIDRASVEDHDLSYYQRQFRRDGILHLSKFMPDALIDRYCSVRDKVTDRGGWNMPCPYLHFEEIRDISLYRPMMQLMKELIGNNMVLHLNLTGYKSTERDFHQDQYLNPYHVASNYIAVWIALDDIHPDAGPFQYVPGSNRWGCISQERVFEIMMKEQGIEPSDPRWPSLTQDWVAQACTDEIIRRSARVVDFLPKKGDVLFWHGRLIHRGSRPRDPDRERKSLIAHYSSILHRPDFQVFKIHESKQWNAEGFYFDSKMPLEGPQRV
jgi:hypothetical protein